MQVLVYRRIQALVKNFLGSYKNTKKKQYMVFFNDPINVAECIKNSRCVVLEARCFVLVSKY